MGLVQINEPLHQRAVVMLHHSVAAQVDVEGFVKGSAQGTPLNVAPARDRRLHFLNWAACVVQWMFRMIFSPTKCTHSHRKQCWQGQKMH